MIKLIALISLMIAGSVFAQFSELEHPRLWLRADVEKQIRHKIEADPLAANLHQAILKEAERILTAPTCRYDIPDGRRLLRQSRLALHHTLHTAWAWRFTGQRKYLERAIAELEAASNMKDWNPPHFLDVAEMATAVAVGYDWLHEALTPAQRAMCERAIRNKALKPAADLYHTNAWWTRATNNWAQVCGSGIALSAIAIQGEDEGLAQSLIEKGIALVKKCEHFYAPDGLYPEGPGYWHYGTNYHIMLLAACETLGHPASMPKLLERSGNTMIHLYGPNRLPFNFADGHARPGSKSPAQAWIANHFDNATQIRNLRSVLERGVDPTCKRVPHRSSPLTLIWLPAAVDSNTPLPTNAVFHGEQATAVFRTSWDIDAAWIAIKGGTPQGGHGHMDIGSFCYDAHGTRWIHDLGSDNYNMPDYFRDKRFSYFRLQNRSHNTLEINKALQDPKCKPCPIISSSLHSNPARADFDLSAAYQNSAQKVLRSVSFDTTTGTAIISDHITNPAGDIAWRAHTDATCTIDGDTVILEKQGKQITIKRLSASGTWSVRKPTPPLEIENANQGYRAVTLSVPQKNRTSIEIEIRP